MTTNTKLHILINLTTDQRRALKAIAGIRGQSLQTLVTEIIISEISQYNQALSKLDKDFSTISLDKIPKIE